LLEELAEKFVAAAWTPDAFRDAQKMPKPATLGSEELPGYGLRRRRLSQFGVPWSNRRLRDPTR
jgi:hypothetical protein